MDKFFRFNEPVAVGRRVTDGELVYLFPFSLEQAMSGREVYTQNFEPVELISINGPGDYPILGLVHSVDETNDQRPVDFSISFTADGRQVKLDEGAPVVFIGRVMKEAYMVMQRLNDNKSCSEFVCSHNVFTSKNAAIVYINHLSVPRDNVELVKVVVPQDFLLPE